MNSGRKQEIINDLQEIVNSFAPTIEEPTLTMYGLISRYNATGKNEELIGGDWVLKNTDIVLD